MLELADEFLIAAYVDGDVAPEGRARVEWLLGNSEEARLLVREYRQLAGLLKLSRETPAVNWESMRDSISSSIDDVAASAGIERETSAAERAILENPEVESLPQERQTTRQLFWASYGSAVVMRRVALAASLLLALGIGWELYRTVRVGGIGVTADRTAAVRPPDGGTFMASASAGRIEVGVGLGQSGDTGIEVGVGPAPQIADEFPSIRMSHEELYPKYGSVRVTPDVKTAKIMQGGGGLPY